MTTAMTTTLMILIIIKNDHSHQRNGHNGHPHKVHPHDGHAPSAHKKQSSFSLSKGKRRAIDETDASRPRRKNASSPSEVLKQLKAPMSTAFEGANVNRLPPAQQNASSPSEVLKQLKAPMSTACHPTRSELWHKRMKRRIFRTAAGLPQSEEHQKQCADDHNSLPRPKGYNNEKAKAWFLAMRKGAKVAQSAGGASSCAVNQQKAGFSLKAYREQRRQAAKGGNPKLRKESHINTTASSVLCNRGVQKPSFAPSKKQSIALQTHCKAVNFLARLASAFQKFN
ncbi:hypothetical protein CBOM_00508 [Ceraceosorus bombacis]|uniref:Uncharacterized protein n=1 Tax=Ceraceosorus bombacis TaxID=401625 RepID=A0A0N7L916_9BASI|nr:hypothetical protein CBOM_00508 [Ceraceosorus bombacis]